MESLRERYNKILYDYSIEFGKIVGLPSQGYGVMHYDNGTLIAEDYAVDFKTMKYIVDNNIDGKSFFDWYDYCLILEENTEGRIKSPSFSDWYEKRVRQLTEEDISRLNKAHERLMESRELLDAEINRILSNTSLGIDDSRITF